jgi:hypothetical protein
MKRHELELKNHEAKEKLIFWMLVPHIFLFFIGLPLIITLIPQLIAIGIFCAISVLYFSFWIKPIFNLNKNYPTSMSRRELKMYDDFKDIDYIKFMRNMNKVIKKQV